MGSMCSKRPIVLHNSKPNKTITKYSKITNFKNKYEYICMLGNGSFGKVRLYRDKNLKDMRFAIKTIRKDGINRAMYEAIIEEVNILRDLDHPNIVKYYDTYEDDHYIHIVMEYLQGDDLFKVITERRYNKFTEKDACEIISYLFKSLIFIHNKHIVHRDIKPENILFGAQGDYQSLKLIDFGLSTSHHSKNKQSVGSPYYMAPEIIDGSYTYKTDIWSVGVILFVMMTGRYPFEGHSQQEVFHKIKFEKYNEQVLNDKKCSDDVKDLIKKLLVKDESARLSIDEALDHPWAKKHNADLTTPKHQSFIENDIIDSLKKFTNSNCFQKEVLFYLAKISSDEEVQMLTTTFRELDKDNSGELTYEEILNAFKILNLNVKQVLLYLNKFRKK